MIVTRALAGFLNLKHFVSTITCVTFPCGCLCVCVCVCFVYIWGFSCFNETTACLLLQFLCEITSFAGIETFIIPMFLALIFSKVNHPESLALTTLFFVFGFLWFRYRRENNRLTSDQSRLQATYREIENQSKFLSEKIAKQQVSGQFVSGYDI